MTALRRFSRAVFLSAFFYLAASSARAEEVVLQPTDPLTTVFHQTADACDFKRFESAYDGMLSSVRSVKIQQFDRNGFTPLTYAARCGCLPIVKFLVQKSAVIDARPDTKHMTPLAHAAEQHHVEVVEHLLKNRADPNAEYGVKRNPFFAAILGSEYDYGDSGHQDNTLLMLLAHKADINARDDNGATPLIVAVQWGDRTLTKFLINNNANVWLLDKHNKTAADYALDDGQRDVLLLLQTKGVHNVKARKAS